MHLSKVLLLLFLLGMLNACGYKMRGSVELPPAMQQVYLQGASGQLKTIFKQALATTKADLVTARKDAGIVFDIIEEEIDRRSISLSSRGKSTEYELNFYLTYELRDSHDNLLVPEQHIEIIKEYFDNQVDVLAKDIEGNIIREEVYQEAARRMIDKARFELKKLELQP